MSCGSPRQVLECASLLVFWRFGDGGEPTKSARGLAQSKTLPRDPEVQGPNAFGKKRKGALYEPDLGVSFDEPLEAPPRFGVRQSCSLLALWHWRRADRNRQPPSRRSGAMARREGGRTGAVQDASARSAGSWSQCMRKSERRLSMHRTSSPHPSPPLGVEE